MSVEAFTVDSKVTIDTTPFESGIAKVTSQLSELSGSMKSMMEMGGGNWNFNGALNGLKTLKDDLAVIKEDIATMNTEFSNIQGIETLRSEILELRREIDAIKQKVNETTTQTVQRVREVKTEISAITSGTEPLVQLWSAMNGQIAEHYDILSYQESEIGQINAQWRETQTSINRTKQLMKQIYNETEGWTTELSRVELQAKQIELYFRREQDILKQSLNYLEQEATLLESQKALEDAKLVAEENLNKAIAERVAFYDETLLEEEKEMEMAYRIMGIQEELNGLIGIEAEEVLKIADSEKLVLETIGQQVAMEEERLALMSEISAMESAQITKMSSANKGKGAKGGKNQLDKMGYLPSRIGSMALTMWGFNELMDVYDKTMGHINAESQKDYFAKRMNMDSKATQDFTNQLNSMQKQYKKLDMTVVGANALETATKYKVQQQSLGDLTEVMAIYGSEFVKQGRSQEDSILAINDALDGELRRLKEVGIGAEELKATGLWDGDESDKEGMLKALLQIAQERGYDKTAKDITNLSDAITTLEVKLSIDLARAFGVIEPLITDVLGNFVTMLEALEGAIAWVTPKITELAKALGLIDKDGNGTKFGNFLEYWASWMITFGITAYGVYKIVKPLVGWLKNLRGATDTVAKTTGGIGNDVGKTMNTGGFKENFKSEWGKLGKNLGKMARVFVEFAVALAMAWALIEEAIILISAIGYTYESLKPQFESGINFIKEFGVWFALLGGAMLVFSYAIGKVPESAMQTVTKGAVKLATGMAIAMGLIAEAIGLLILPLGAIIILGATYNWQQSNVESGLKVIKGVGTVLNTIASDDSIMVFLLGFMAVSTIMAYGGAELIALPLAIGMAVTMGLIAEAIGLLILPLGAIALLGASASALNEENINQGAETIRMIGRVLKVLSSAMVDLFIVDIATLGVMLTEKASQLLTGKTGLQALTDDIIPSLTDFISDFNGLDMGEPVDQAKVQAIQQMATDIPPLFQAIQKVNNALGTSDAVGNIFGALGGGISGAIGMGLSSKLDQLYNDIKDVMDFANKLGGLGTGGNANTTAIQQTANAITQLKTKLNLFITTISGASSRVQSASQKLGNALPTGFKTGSASFGSAVVSVLAKGVSEIQSRYATFNNGGKTLGQKLIDGFKNHKPTLKTITSREIGYALTELDNAKDDFYNKGKSLGEELTRGYQDGADIHSPGLIARTTARELRYTMDALDTGKKMMYQGGVALGQALTNGYNSYGNLRTDVGVLASKGVSNEQLQANAKNTQLNGNHKGQTPQLTQTNINIDMSNSTVIGVQDLDNKIRQAVEKAIVSINSPNGAIGY